MENAMNQAVGFVMDPLTALWAKVAAVLPNLFGALVLIVVGAVLAKLTSKVLARVLGALGLDGLSERVHLAQALEGMGVKRRASEVAGWLVGAFVFVAFLLSALDAVGLGAASDAVRSLLLYLPKVFGALVVLIAGLWLARAAGAAAERTAEGAGLDAAKAIGRGAYGVVAFLAALLAFRQLELDVGIIAEVVGIVLLAAGAAGAIALGLGARTLAAELLAGAYARDLVSPGDELELEDGTKGELVEVGAVKTVLKLADGRFLSLPNQALVAARVIRKAAQ